MNMQQQAPAAAKRRPKSALNWVDLLVTAATVLTFAVVVFANTSHSRRQNSPWLLKDTSIQTGQLLDVNTDIVKARVRIALGS